MVVPRLIGWRQEVQGGLAVPTLGMGQDWPRPINIFLSLCFNSGTGLNSGLRQSAHSPCFPRGLVRLLKAALDVQ